MRTLLIVGGGFFGSLAAAYARSRGVEALVFDGGLPGAASPAAAGLFKEAWAGKKLRAHFLNALPVLERLYEIRSLPLLRDDGVADAHLFIPPAAILEPTPIRQRVDAVGDGWLEAEGRRHEGLVYVAAGVWAGRFLPSLSIHGKTGAAFLFPGERPGRIHETASSQKIISFVRDSATTYFSDGTAERDYSEEHDQRSLARAAEVGLTEPSRRLWGIRPYVAGGPVFQKIASRTWLATGGRKMGLVLGASCARRLVEEELR